MSEKLLNESSQPLTSRVVKETCYDGDSEDSMYLESNTSFPSNDNDSVEVLSNTLAKYLLNYEKTDMKRDDIGESVKLQPKSAKDVVTYKDLIEFLSGQPFDEPEPEGGNLLHWSK
ncbi:CLUMA_CG003609, isoform A [Clunio marinus]|uniref:CLUMA_CG003609, isoform A n=1 Tax=Clunio marinus TaxID=568069 RepID=A0A1J1HQK4_9DIPT|nr:CLUMA_CG003609, isoform A [Clunio marinus]